MATSWYSDCRGESRECADLGGLERVGDGLESFDALPLCDSFGHRGMSFRFAVDVGCACGSDGPAPPLDPGSVEVSGLDPDAVFLLSRVWLFADDGRDPSSEGVAASGADLASSCVRLGEALR